MTEFIEKATGQVVTAERFMPERQPWPDGIINYSNDVVMGAYGLPISDKWVALLGNGDWIVTRPDGYRTVCRQDVFPDSYEPRAGEYVRLVEQRQESGAEAGLRRAWRDAQDGRVHPVSELWDGLDDADKERAAVDAALDDLDDVFYKDTPLPAVKKRRRGRSGL
jgi:hypothetical protein